MVKTKKNNETIRVEISGEVRDFANAVPADKEVRQSFESLTKTFLEGKDVLMPLRRQDILFLTEEMIEETGINTHFSLYLSVLISNQLNLRAFRQTPVRNRLLLLPHCLRDRTACKGEFDELGLICASCGACKLQSLADAAEEQGLMVIISEGTGSAAELVRSGAAQALIGVGCLNSLTRIQQKIEKAAVPSLAIPLLADGCIDTDVDADELLKYINLPAEEDRSVPMGNLRKAVQNYFTAEKLGLFLQTGDGDTEQLALKAILNGGRRWRPYLCAAVYRSLSRREDYSRETEKLLCAAVECFHKASLVHDDIEDGDIRRDDYPTLAADAGTDRALNAGDWLIGKGYQLLTETELDASIKVSLVREASTAHLRLCSGQGEELNLQRKGIVPDWEDVRRIYSNKTSAAFEISLILGALAAGADVQLVTALKNYADKLGLLYQIRDDLSDSDKEASLYHQAAEAGYINEPTDRILNELEQDIYGILNRITVGKLKTFLFRLMQQVTADE